MTLSLYVIGICGTSGCHVSVLGSMSLPDRARFPGRRCWRGGTSATLAHAEVMVVISQSSLFPVKRADVRGLV